MKKLDKIMLACAVLMTAAGSAAAQIRVTQTEYEENRMPLELRMDRNNVAVAFDMEIGQNFIRSREVSVITPVFIGNSYRQELPPIVVRGRQYTIIADEKSRFDGVASPMQVAESSRHLVDFRGRETTVRYQTRVPFDPRMRNAMFVLEKKTYSICGLGTGRKDEATGIRPGGLEPVSVEIIPLAVGVISEMPRPDTVRLQTPREVEGRYENNFMNRSVFRLNSKTIDMDAFHRYGYEELRREVEALKADPNTRIIGVEVHAAASPDGPLANNRRLAEARATAIADYLIKNLGIQASLIERFWVDENWDAFMHDLDQSNLANKAEIRRIVASTADLDARERELRRLSNWREILAMFQNLRNARVVIEYVTREMTEEIMIRGWMRAVPESGAVTLSSEPPFGARPLPGGAERTARNAETAATREAQRVDRDVQRATRDAERAARNAESAATRATQRVDRDAQRAATNAERAARNAETATTRAAQRAEREGDRAVRTEERAAQNAERTLARNAERVEKSAARDAERLEKSAVKEARKLEKDAEKLARNEARIAQREIQEQERNARREARAAQRAAGN
ncbi:MAG: hypothetical protein FWE10_05270 [Rikenellaceae bacterium]|nr:hypothetical protein [Rikenellaceae bacterium]MCL2692707.1 hypothetical protein [Rikenellaceae bacterium]